MWVLGLRCRFVGAAGPFCLHVFLSAMQFFIFDSRLSLLFSFLVSSRMCVSARLFVSVLWSWSWSCLVLVLDLVLILIIVLALISCSLDLLVVGLHVIVLFLVWLVGLSSCPLGVGLSVDPWVLWSWSWPLVPGLSLGLLVFVLVMASWS